MIEGYVTGKRVPLIPLRIGNSEQMAVVDSGFNGDLDLPMSLLADLPIRPAGDVTSTLANGTTITQDLFQIDIEFDGEDSRAFATFSDTDEVLVGTRLMRRHRLEIDFPARTLRLERVE